MGPLTVHQYNTRAPHAGDRKHERRSASPKAPPHEGQQAAEAAQQHLSSVFPAFGPQSSIDISKLPATQTPIFPIPEGQEATFLYQVQRR